MPAESWPLGRPEREPGPGDVHLWLVDLGAPEGLLEPDTALLSPDERKRAARFVFERHRRRFVLARAALRRLLGAYLQRAPESLGFRYDPAGKPHLARVERLQFNLAHSEDRALVAVVLERRVGVDLEALRPMDDAETIARSFFTPAEAEALARVTAADRQRAFFRIWTRKEALLKALGEGIAGDGLRAMEVGRDPLGPAALTAFPGPPEAASAWSLLDLTVSSDCAAALAVEGPLGSVHQHRWTS